MKMTILVGNPSPHSRTRLLAEAVGSAISSLASTETGSLIPSTIDLAEYAGSIFDPNAAKLVALTQQVAASDLIVVASPTYKAAYTGLLKAFFDRYDTNALAGTIAVPIMTGGSPAHALAPDITLRPLLVELGASVPTRSLFFLTSQLPQLNEIVGAWLSANQAALLGALRARPAR
jgi:FMN reductase